MNFLTCVTWVEDFREKIPLDKTHSRIQHRLESSEEYLESHLIKHI